jgi:ABC-type branched-subunit amino acid transport system ATPase component
MDQLRCQSVSKSFDGVKALSSLDITFPSKGIAAIIGPNGAGKTTMLNVMTGFLKPESGRCFLGEFDITGISPQRIVQLGVARTFQNLRLILQVSVLDNIMLAKPGQRGESFLGAISGIGVTREESTNREEAIDLLTFVGLEAMANELAGALSYGQQKLLTLACCLATGARILFLDEPVSGVHPLMIAKLLDLMRKLRDQGKVILFIEHDISAVREVADEVIVMDHGKVRIQGPPTEILQRQEIMEAYLA